MEICITNHNSTFALMNIRSKYPECKFENGRLIFSKYNLSLSFIIQDISRKNSATIAHILFEAMHPLFDIPVLELSVGTGKTSDEAINEAIDHYLTGVLESMFLSLDDSPKETITCETAGKQHIFYMPSKCFTVVAGQRNPEPPDIYSVVSDMIPQYLGSNKTYRIKLFASCSGGNVFCQASINNNLSFNLTSVLEQYAESWTDKQKFHSEKQYLLLIQDSSTYQPYPFTFSQVRDYTLKTMELIKNTNSIHTIIDDVISICSDASLATDLCFFIPEIYCSAAMNLKETDDITINTGTLSLCLKKTQSISYGYIEKIIKDYLAEFHPSKDDSMKIIRFSAKLGAIKKAVNDGETIDDLIFSGSVFNAFDDYVLR